MEPWVWTIVIGSLAASLLSGLYGLYEVRKFDRRWGKESEWDR